MSVYVEGNDKVLCCRYASRAMAQWRESPVSGVMTPQAIHAISVITRLRGTSTKLCRISKSIWLDNNNEEIVWDTVQEDKTETSRQLEAWIMNDRSKAELNCWFISGDTSFQNCMISSWRQKQRWRQTGRHTKKGWQQRISGTKYFSCHRQIPKYSCDCQRWLVRADTVHM